MAVSPTPTLRTALRYMAWWSPLVLLYTLMIGSNGRVSVPVAVVSALFTVGAAAMLGVGVVALGRRWDWPGRLTADFLLSHLALALLYAGLWDLTIIASMTVEAGGMREAVAIAHPWIFWQTFEGMLLYAAVIGMTWASRAAERGREQAERVARADALRAEAELAALRGQLDPHFLFNTLHSVSVLVQRDQAAASAALERLAALLRYVLDTRRGAREDVPLEDELAFVDDYLSLESIRFGERLHVTRDISDDARRELVPSFALQPLVENAIKHAIAPRAGGGRLLLSGSVEGASLVLQVSDDGPGTNTATSPLGTGVGLDALRRRLAARYGARATMDVTSAPGAGFTVTLRLPT
jgi:two-component system LytT family sensor kinase